MHPSALPLRSLVVAPLAPVHGESAITQASALDGQR